PGEFRNAWIECVWKLEVSVENLPGIDGAGGAGPHWPRLRQNRNAVVADLPETMRSIEHGTRGIQGQRTATNGSVVGVCPGEKIAAQFEHLSGREHRVTGDGLKQHGELKCRGRRRLEILAAGEDDPAILHGRLALAVRFVVGP